MKNILSQRWLGLITGLILPVIGVFLVLQARPELLGMQRFEGDIVKHVNTQIITLGIIINAAVFFISMQLGKEEFGKSILSACVLYLIAIFVYRFLL